MNVLLEHSKATPHVELSKDTQEVLRVFWVTLFLNLFVAINKLVLGYMTATLSLIADGFHSVLDASANIVGIFSIKFAAIPPDSDHPYGHGKFEAFGAIIISFFMFLASFNIFEDSFHRFTDPEPHLPTVNVISYGVILLSLVISLWVSRYEKRKGKELKNELLIADSQHTLSDVYNSISVIVALVAIQLGWIWMDVVVAIVIVVTIFKAGYDIISAHMGSLVDEAVLDPEGVKANVLAIEGVINCHRIRSRGLKNSVFIDLHIQVDPQMTVEKAHKVAHVVEDKLMALEDYGVIDVLVHVEDAIASDYMI